MSAHSITMPFPARLRAPLNIDPVLLGMAAGLLCVDVWSSLRPPQFPISDNTEKRRPASLCRPAGHRRVDRRGRRACRAVHSIACLSNTGPLLLLAGLVMLMVVLIPGIGYTVNGSTRWLRIGVMNLQVSEPVRLCIIMYLAGYLVRQNKAVREQFTGFLRPMVVKNICLRPAVGRAGFRCRHRPPPRDLVGDAVRCRRAVS